MANIAITGAARGIAFEIAKQHLEQGDRVFAFARSPETASALNTLAQESAGLLTVHTMDVANTSSVNEAASALGDVQIDTLYNVAGITGQTRVKFGAIDWEAFDEVYEVNVKGPLRTLDAFLPRLPSGAKVINVSTQLAASTWPTGGYWAYGSSKAALNRLMRSIAVDLKERGIIIGLVHPGYVQTDMGGPNADITPDESARSIITLADRLGPDDSGEFFKWNGEKHAW